MRAKEFVQEQVVGKLPKRYQRVAKGVSVYGDSSGINSDYTSYRVGLAVACADGTTPLDVDGLSWYGKQKTAQPYTEIEQKMLDQAYEVTGASHNDHNKGKNFKSQELDGVNVVSPVSQWNKKS